MFIEVTLIDGTACMIDIGDISYFFRRRDGYCTIVMCTNAITLETRNSYSDMKREIDLELNK